MKKPCEICSTLTSPICYKLYICASCRLFYRRNFKLWGHIKCENNEECRLQNGGRRSCQYCRLKACRDKGLRMVNKSLIVQENGQPVDDIVESPKEISNKFPFLQRVVNAFKHFYDRQILVVTSELQYELIADTAENSMHMTKMEFNPMEHKVLVLACSTVLELLNEIPNLNDEIRIGIIKETVVDASIILKAFLTSKRFPDFGDTRMALFTGYHFDMNDSPSFLCGFPKDFIEKSTKLFEPFFRTCSISLDRIKHSQMSFQEFAALLAFCVYDSLDKKDNVDKNSVFKLRDRLSSQLSAYLRQLFSIEETCLRISRLFSFIHDVKECHTFNKETNLLSNVFMWNFTAETNMLQYPDLSEQYIKNMASFRICQ